MYGKKSQICSDESLMSIRLSDSQFFYKFVKCAFATSSSHRYTIVEEDVQIIRNAFKIGGSVDSIVQQQYIYCLIGR